MYYVLELSLPQFSVYDLLAFLRNMSLNTDGLRSKGKELWVFNYKLCKMTKNLLLSYV